MMMKIHNNFHLEIQQSSEVKWRMTYYNNRKDFEEYYDKKFYPVSIMTKNNSLVCNTEEINEFLELLGAFISNQLQPNKYYEFIYKDGGGFIGKVVTKTDENNKKIVYLGLKIDNKENYLLEKYDCRVIIANAKQILSKCTLREFI